MRRRENELVSVTEAARRLGVSLSTVWRMLRRGDLPSVRKSGRRMVPQRALERSERRRTPASLPNMGPDHPMWRLVGAGRGGAGPGSGDKHAVLAKLK